MVHLSATLIIILAFFAASPALGIVRLPRSLPLECHYGYCLRREYVEARRPNAERGHRSPAVMERRGSWEAFQAFQARENVMKSRERFGSREELEARSPIVILPGSEFHFKPTPIFNGHHLMILREMQAQNSDDHPVPASRPRIARERE